MSHWPCSACAVALERQVGVARPCAPTAGACEQRERREQHDRAQLIAVGRQRGGDRRILEPMRPRPSQPPICSASRIAGRARRFDQDAQVGRLALHRPVVARERERARARRLRSSGESAPPRAGAGCRRAGARRRSAPPSSVAMRGERRRAASGSRCSASASRSSKRVVARVVAQQRQHFARATAVEQEVGVRALADRRRADRARAPRGNAVSAAAQSPRRAAISAASVSAHSRTPAASRGSASVPVERVVGDRGVARQARRCRVAPGHHHRGCMACQLVRNRGAHRRNDPPPPSTVARVRRA